MDDKTDQRIVFYMTKSEKELLQVYCKKTSAKCSTILRNNTLEMLGKKFREITQHDVDFLKYLAELSANSNNLNQIAKKVNQGVSFNILDERKIEGQIRIIAEQIEELKLKL